MMRTLTPLIIACLLQACASRQPLSCDSATLAIDAVSLRKTADEAWLQKKCLTSDRKAFDTAFAKAVSLACPGRQAWDQGLKRLEKNGYCAAQAGRVWLEAYELGRQYSSLSDQKTEIEQELPSAEGQRAVSLRRELRRVTRELEAITGAGQVRGWLKPDFAPQGSE